MPNNTFERTGIQCGRIVLAIDCVFAGAKPHRGRPLNAIVRQLPEIVRLDMPYMI